MQRLSPIMLMQRQFAHADRMAGFGLLGGSLAVARRSQALRGFGDSPLLRSAGGAYTGASAGAAAGSLVLGGASTVLGTIGGAAAAGSFVPIIGTAIGAVIGLVASGVFNHRVDPEVGNFNNAMQLAKTSGAQAVFNIQDKYLVLAGLFDLEPGQIKGNIPFYRKYGRMGEFAFVMDMMRKVQAAADAGLITANDTVQSVYDKVVAPWIASWGLGPLQDYNAEMLTNILIGLIGEYVTGLYKQRWYARSGDFPFGSLQPFHLPTAAAYSPGPAGTPTPATQAPPPTAAPSGPTADFVPTGQSDPQYGLTYRRAADPNLYAWWQGHPLVIPSSSSGTAAAQPPQVPVQSAVPIPAGFAVIGSNLATGAPLYGGPDGRYYSWNGVTMTPFSGSVFTAGQIINTSNGVLVPPQTGPLQYGPTVPPQYQAQPFAPTQPSFAPAQPVNVSVTAPSQPMIASAAASGSGLPGWLIPAALGAGALLLG
jgi:hypothetical protein